MVAENTKLSTRPNPWSQPPRSRLQVQPEAPIVTMVRVGHHPDLDPAIGGQGRQRILGSARHQGEALDGATGAKARGRALHGGDDVVTGHGAKRPYTYICSRLSRPFMLLPGSVHQLMMLITNEASRE